MLSTGGHAICDNVLFLMRCDNDKFKTNADIIQYNTRQVSRGLIVRTSAGQGPRWEKGMEKGRGMKGRGKGLTIKSDTIKNPILITINVPNVAVMWPGDITSRAHRKR